MDLALTADQELFRSTTQRFIEDNCSLERVRAMLEAPLAHDPALIGPASELGWFSFFVDAELGGGSVSDQPVRDAVLVAEERGRFVQPGPFTATNVVCFAVSKFGSEAQRKAHLPSLASGESVGTWAVSQADGGPGALQATANADGYVLDGVAHLVPDATVADVVLATAAGPDGPVHLLLEQPVGELAESSSLDLTRRFCTLRFDGVEVPAAAVLGGAAGGGLGELFDLAALLTVAESVGAMRELVSLTVEYAKTRIAFGRPIGSFQALKHLLADASLCVEVSAAAATAASRGVADAHPAASEMVSIAKSYAGDAGIDIAQICLQVLGGIGFTWEHDLHLYLRRLAVDRVLYGDPCWHNERICRIHDLSRL